MNRTFVWLGDVLGWGNFLTLVGVLLIGLGTVGLEPLTENVAVEPPHWWLATAITTALAAGVATIALSSMTIFPEISHKSVVISVVACFAALVCFTDAETLLSPPRGMWMVAMLTGFGLVDSMAAVAAFRVFRAIDRGPPVLDGTAYDGS